MTEKEFHKLRRRDLLELLVVQGKENIQLQEELDEKKEELARSNESNERLKAKLDEKDALIEKLKGRLDKKDMRIQRLRNTMEEWRSSRKIELEEAGSIAEAALRLSGIFQVAQEAADQYLYNIREKYRASGAGNDDAGEALDDSSPGEGSYGRDRHGYEET